MNLSSTIISTMAIPVAVASAFSASPAGAVPAKSELRTDALLRRAPLETEIKIESSTGDLGLLPLDRLRLRTLEYATFKAGWDGPGSEGVSAVASQAAQRLIDLLPGGLPLPDVSVSSTGELAFYWDLPGGYAEISFEDSDRATFFSRTYLGEENYAEGLPLGALTRSWFFSALGGLAAPTKLAA